MGFTKAQRLKGLKKQLKNLGYDMVSTGSSPVPSNDVAEVDSGERGTHTLASMKAKEEAW